MTTQEIINQCSKEQAEAIFLKTQDIIDIIKEVTNKDFGTLMVEYELYFVLSKLSNAAFFKYVNSKNQ